ncbi:MAG TPA: DUF6683 family protein [Pyrinomonadaceae bacterium]|nr:DUF6683 family protein [Pyrinomonadaceae bacterium]
MAGTFVLLLPACGDARAQAGPSMYNLPIQQSMQTMNLSHRLFLMRRASSRRGATSSAGRARRGGGGGPIAGSPVRTTTPGPVRGAVEGVTTFRQVEPSIAPAYLARTIARNAEERPRLERMFSDLLENFRDNARRGGGEINDVARAATYLIAASYTAYTDAPPLAGTSYAALREQVREAFAADAQFQSMSDREKQRVFESYAITGAWLDIGYQIVKREGDRQGVEQWRQMARVNLQNMLGAAPEQVRFTETGVVYR